MSETSEDDRPAIPRGATAEVLEWVDQGWRERARQVLEAQAALPDGERNLELTAELFAALEGVTVADLGPSSELVGGKSPSVTARERQMYEAEIAAASRS